MVGDGALDGVGEVVPDMPPIGHLQRVGCAGPGAIGVDTSPVPADEVHAGMRA